MVKTKRDYGFVVVYLVVAAVAFADVAHAHNAGRDYLCCHRDNREDEYHCHDGPLDGRTFSSREEAERFLATDGQELESVQVRNLYDHWIDADGDGEDTRQEVLILESRTPVTFFEDEPEKVDTGEWWDPYTGRTYVHACMLQIDHFIPIGEVHESGGYLWSEEERRRYANDLDDPDTLIAVSASANMSKRDKDPAKWLPENQDYHCEYLRTWRRQKLHWGLTMDPEEEAAVEEGLEECP